MLRMQNIMKTFTNLNKTNLTLYQKRLGITILYWTLLCLDEITLSAYTDSMVILKRGK